MYLRNSNLAHVRPVSSDSAAASAHRRRTDLGRFELFCLEFLVTPFSLLLDHTDCTVTSSLQVRRAGCSASPDEAPSAWLLCYSRRSALRFCKLLLQGLNGLG